jgi:hypothetical protein
MARKRREFNVFNVSFLDCMSCGFGAVVLFFMIINHASEVRSATINKDLISEVDQLEALVLAGERHLVELRNSSEAADKETAITEGLSRQVLKDLDVTRQQLADMSHLTVAQKEHLNQLKADLKAKEEERKRLLEEGRDQADEGGALRSFVGQGDRQYLTGLKMGGKRILILVDASASMLDETIVNIIRRRNMSDEQKRASRKWQRALATVDWLTAQIPSQSQFQIFAFNTRATPMLEGTEGQWIDTEQGQKLDEAVASLRQLIPEGGTSLFPPVRVVASLKPAPDNIYLVTDSLPTQGESRPSGSTVNAKQRMKFFESALRELPLGIPVNVILFPMEGDAMAAGAFWQLAQVTGGSFMSPSKDWP